MSERRESFLFPPWLESIIEKKTNEIALSCFEAIAHWFLTTFSCFYPAYSRLYNYNLPEAREIRGDIKFEDQEGILNDFLDKAERIHQFGRNAPGGYDGTGLLDLTAQKIASIMIKDGRGHCTPRHPAYGEVTLHDRPVVFKPTNEGDDFNFGFGKSRGTKYLTVEDFPDHPGQFKITEYKIGLPPNHWIVDTNKKYQEHRFMLEGCFGGREWYDPVYVTEDAIPNIAANDNYPYLRLEL